MRVIIFIFLLAPFFVQAQRLTGKRWVINNSQVIANGDTLTLFKNDTANYGPNLSNISYKFIEDGSYSGTNFTGGIMNGIWQYKGNQVSIDGSTSSIQFYGEDSFSLSYNYLIMDTAGNKSPAISLIQFINEPLGELEVLLFPNPVREFLNVKITAPAKFDAAIDLYDILGRKIYSIPLKTFNNKNDFSINLKGQNSGQYLFVLKSGKTVITKKVIIIPFK